MRIHAKQIYKQTRQYRLMVQMTSGLLQSRRQTEQPQLSSFPPEVRRK